MNVQKIVDFVNAKGTETGFSIEDLCRAFPSTDKDDVRRLANAAYDMGDIHREGVGRGLRYGKIGVELIKREKIEKPAIIKLTSKEQIKEILESANPLNEPVEFNFSEREALGTSGKELRDFLEGGLSVHKIKLIYDSIKKKNIKYSEKIEYTYNAYEVKKLNSEYMIIFKEAGISHQYFKTKEFKNVNALNDYLKKNV